MKSSFFAIVGVSVLVSAFAEPSGDRPDAWHAWAVHDVNRPNPPVVTVPEGGIPSDAIVLFDGTQESVDRHWRSEDGSPTKWTVKDGTFVCTPGSGSAFTVEDFGDCQLHVEWQTPVNDVEGWGNSGVILMKRYEIQILDSFGIEESKSPWKPANYADGQAGSVYGQNPPLVNPCRRTGVWQSYDIVFHPPFRENGKVVDPGSFTVFFNGVLVQDAWPLQGMTTWCRRLTNHIEVAEAPLRLQDHGHPVPFRNIWIRRIPSRYADTTGGGAGTKSADVAKLRHELAVQSLAFAEAADEPGEKFIRLWESYCYERNDAVRAQASRTETACVDALAKRQGVFGDDRKFRAFKRFVEMLVNTGWMSADAEIKRALDAAKEPPKPTALNLRDV